MPVNGKVKGAAAEREAAALLTLWAKQVGITVDLTRNLEQTRGGGHDLCGLEEYGMAVEVKRVENPNMTSFWAQAVRQAKAVNCIPVLMWRQNRKPWAFRIQAHVWPCHQSLAIDLDMTEFAKWYQAQLGAAHATIKT